jgi:large conductance mechanosensitive channel
MLKDFKEFAFKGNVIDLAVAVVIGGAFGAIVSSFVDDIVNPLVGLLLGSTDLTNLFVVLSEGTQPGPYPSLEAARAAGAAALGYGAFLNTVVNFLIIAFAIFLAIRALSRLRRAEEEVTTRACPYCTTDIAKAASKCPACTADVTPEQA